MWWFCSRTQIYIVRVRICCFGSAWTNFGLGSSAGKGPVQPSALLAMDRRMMTILLFVIVARQFSHFILCAL
jgi:hypothetical protein